jgi:hypothetical protein
MTLPRIVFVTRRFWPLLGGAVTIIGNLAAALVEKKGISPIIPIQQSAKRMQLVNWTYPLFNT